MSLWMRWLISANPRVDVTPTAQFDRLEDGPAARERRASTRRTNWWLRRRKTADDRLLDRLEHETWGPR